MIKRELNKYEKRVMFNLNLIRSLCVIAIILNLVLPLIERPKFTLFLITQVIAIGAIHIFAFIKVAWAQTVPIVATFFIRIIQSMIFIVWRGDISWTIMGIFVFIDILIIIMMVLDKSRYMYKVYKASDDEFMKF